MQLMVMKYDEGVHAPYKLKANRELMMLQKVLLRDAVKTQSSNAVLLLQGAVSRLTEAKGKMEQERKRAQADAEAQHARHRACLSRIEQLEQALLNAGVTLPVLECDWLIS